MRPRTVALSCLTLFVLGPVALADVLVPVYQDRSVSGSATAGDASGDVSDADSAEALDFGPFMEGVGVTVSVFDGLGSGGGSQNSVILPTAILAAGSAFANGEGYSNEGYGSGSGASYFYVVFDLMFPCEYSLFGFVEAFDNGGSSVSLRREGTLIYGAGAGNEQVSFHETGILGRGRYMLTAGSSGGAFGGGGFFDYASGAYDVALGLTCIRAPYIERTGPANGPFDGGEIVLFSQVREVLRARRERDLLAAAR